MKKSLKKVLIHGIILLMILLLVSTVLIITETRFFRQREAESLQVQLENIGDLMEELSQENIAVEQCFEENIGSNVRLMVSALQTFVTEEGYTGPRMFDDGMVIEFQGDRTIYPDEMRPGFLRITREMVMAGLSGKNAIMDEVLSYPPATRDEQYDPEEVPESLVPDEVLEDLKNKVLLSYGEIAENLYYVDWTSLEEYYEYVLYSSDASTMLHDAEESFGGALLMVSMSEGSDLILLANSIYFPDVASASELGFTRKMIEDRENLVFLEGKPWLCDYLQDRYTNAVSGKDDEIVLICLTPLSAPLMRNVLRTMAVVFMMLLVLIPIAVYVTALRNKIRSQHQAGTLTGYPSPAVVARHMLEAGAAGAVVIFLFGMLLHAMGMVYTETLTAQNTLTIFQNRVAESLSEDKSTSVRLEEEWFLYYAQRIADLISEHPALGTREKLQEYCEILDIDMVTLFDHEGHETLCSGDYVDLNLRQDMDEMSADFTRLLIGVPGIVHDASLSRTTGLNRQNVGVRLQDQGGQGHYGALILTIDPSRIQHTERVVGLNGWLPHLLMNDRTVFAASQEGGAILYTVDNQFLDETIQDLSLPASTLQDDYMDFSILNGDRCYIVTDKRDKVVYFYAAQTSVLFGTMVPYGLISVAGYLLILSALLIVLMRDYREQVGSLSTGQNKSPETGPVAIDAPLPGKNWTFHFTPWWEREPGEKAISILRIMLLIGILAVYLTSLSSSASYRDQDSLFIYILYGDWMRGINLFAFSAIAIISCGLLAMITLLRSFLQMISGFSGSRGETVCRLIYSMLQYAVLFALLYLAFSYLGFPTSTIVASLSLATLALTLGAQNLVSDILAGIFIVFEDEFQVGDAVEIDGFYATVREIGIRSTKLLNRDGDIKIIDNHTISTVINKSRFMSRCTIELKISADESLDRLEAILNKYLPEIGDRYEKILIGPFYLGMGAPASGLVPHTATMTLLVRAYFKEEDAFEMERCLNRELRIMCEREKIELR